MSSRVESLIRSIHDIPFTEPLTRSFARYTDPHNLVPLADGTVYGVFQDDLVDALELESPECGMILHASAEEFLQGAPSTLTMVRASLPEVTTIVQSRALPHYAVDDLRPVLHMTAGRTFVGRENVGVSSGLMTYGFDSQWVKGRFYYPEERLLAACARRVDENFAADVQYYFKSRKIPPPQFSGHNDDPIVLGFRSLR